MENIKSVNIEKDILKNQPVAKTETNQKASGQSGKQNSKMADLRRKAESVDSVNEEYSDFLNTLSQFGLGSGKEEVLKNVQSQSEKSSKNNELLAKAAMEKDLRDIKKICPWEKAKSMEEIKGAEKYFEYFELGLCAIDAYKLANFDDFIKHAQNEMNEKIKQNSYASPGAIGTDVMGKVKDFSQMNDEEFEEFVLRAKRGEYTKRKEK